MGGKRRLKIEKKIREEKGSGRIENTSVLLLSTVNSFPI